MPYVFLTETDLVREAPRYPRLLGESSTAISFTNEDALAWAKEIRDYTLNFTEHMTYRNHVAGVDPFTRAEDGKYLVYLADDGTLKEMVPADQRKESLNDPEFCRRMATLSQEGRLFMRKPGDQNYRQLESIYEKEQGDRKERIVIRQAGATHDPLNLQPREIPAPVTPKAPFFLKYLLYPFSKSIRDEFKTYNEQKRFFDENLGKMIADRAAYTENLTNSLRQLDDCGLDADALEKEVEQRNIAKERWAEDIRREKGRSMMRDKGITDEQILKCENQMRKLSVEREQYQPIRPLQFKSNIDMLKVAYYGYTDQKMKKTYLEVLESMEPDDIGLDNFDASDRAHIVADCFATNILELKKRSVDDPMYRKLLEMNEALLGYVAKNVSKFSGMKVNDIDFEFFKGRHDTYKTMYEHREYLLGHKMKALDEAWTTQPAKWTNTIKDHVASSILLEVLKVTDLTHKITGAVAPNPITMQLGAGDDPLIALINTIPSTDTFKDLQKLSSQEVVDILLDQRRMLELAEKITREPYFNKYQAELQLDEHLEEAKSYDVYGDKSTLNSDKITEFEENLRNDAALDTKDIITDELKSEVMTPESYAETIERTLKQQLADILVQAVDKVPEKDKNVYLVHFRRPYKMILDRLNDFVSNTIDEDRIQAICDEGYKEGYENNPDRKAAIENEIRDMVKNGLQKYCEYDPEYANTLHLQKVIQQPQVKQSAPQLQQVQQQMQQPEAQSKPASVPGL